MTFLRTLLAILALISQLTLGALVAPDRAAAATPDAVHAVALHCGPASAQHRDRHQAPRPLAAVLALPAVILPPEPGIPGSDAFARRIAHAAFAARAPPVRALPVPPATGPPAPL